MPAYIFVSIHQMAPPLTERQVFDAAYYSFIDPGRDERLSWPGWLTCIADGLPT